MIRDNKILSLFDSIHWPVARLTFRENDSKDTKKIENSTGFEQKPRFTPRTKSRIFSILQFFIIFLHYNLLRIMKRGKRRRIRIFIEKKYLRIRLNLQFEFVANNLLRVSSLSWNKRRYSKGKEHRMCACYTSGPEGRKVAPVLCNRIVWPLWARVLYKLHDFFDCVICTYVNRTLFLNCGTRKRTNEKSRAKFINVSWCSWIPSNIY